MRKDGRREVTITVGLSPEGKPIRRHFYGDTMQEARAKRDAYRRDVESGLTADGSIYVYEWLEKFISVYHPKGMDSFIARLRDRIGGKRLSDVREIDLQKELNSCEGMSSSYISKYSQLMKRVFMRARTNRLISFDPAENLILPKGTAGTHRALDKSETELLISHAMEHRCGIWVLLMLLCGLRRGEMIALQWDCIDLENRLLHVRRTAEIKSNQPDVKERAKSIAGIRTLPICEILYTALASLHEREGFVCRTAAGKPISETAFNRGLESFMTKMSEYGHPVRFRAHDLRHTFATMLYEAGVDAKAAQYYLGHSDIKLTLDLYTHLSQARNKTEMSKAVNFLDAFQPVFSTPVVKMSSNILPDAYHSQSD